VRLVEQHGLTLRQAAEALALPAGRVERLLEEEADRLALSTLSVDRVPNAPLRDRLARLRSRDPELTVSELARRVGTSPIQVQRWLGIKPTAPKTDRRGRRYPGRLLESVDVDVAGRIARAMGLAPHEIDGC
jgi:hypothetical protein